MKPYGVDIDDVLADFSAMLSASLMRRYPNALPHQYWDSFDVCTSFSIDYENFLQHIIDDEIIERCLPFDHAKKAMDQLYACGAEIVLITSRGYHPVAQELTKAWLTKHGIPHSDLIIVPHGQTKAEASIHQYPKGFQAMIDDLPKNLDDMQRAGLTSQPVLITRPWNKDRTDFRLGANRFNSVLDYVNHLKKSYRRDFDLDLRAVV